FNGVSPTFAPHARPLLDAYARENRSLIDQLQAIVQAGEIKDGATLDKALTDSRETRFALWRGASPEMEHLLAMRIADRRTQLMWGLSGMALAIAVTGLLTWLILRNLTGFVGSITDGLRATSARIFDVCRELQASGRQIAQGAKQQAANIEEAAA